MRLFRAVIFLIAATLLLGSCNLIRYGDLINDIKSGSVVIQGSTDPVGTRFLELRENGNFHSNVFVKSISMDALYVDGTWSIEGNTLTLTPTTVGTMERLTSQAWSRFPLNAADFSPVTYTYAYTSGVLSLVQSSKKLAKVFTDSFMSNKACVLYRAQFGDEPDPLYLTNGSNTTKLE